MSIDADDFPKPESGCQRIDYTILLTSTTVLDSLSDCPPVSRHSESYSSTIIRSKSPTVRNQFKCFIVLMLRTLYVYVLHKLFKAATEAMQYHSHYIVHNKVNAFWSLAPCRYPFRHPLRVSQTHEVPSENIVDLCTFLHIPARLPCAHWSVFPFRRAEGSGTHTHVRANTK